jgi:hypothetical protein
MREVSTSQPYMNEHDLNYSIAILDSGVEGLEAAFLWWCQDSLTKNQRELFLRHPRLIFVCASDGEMLQYTAKNIEMTKR